jgi:hypothetical protein
VVNRAQAEAVAHKRFSVQIGVGDDVRRIEKSCLLEPADRTLVSVCGKNDAAEPTLVQPRAHFADCVLALERVVDRCRLRLVHRARELARSKGDPPLRWVVVGDPPRIERLV